MDFSVLYKQETSHFHCRLMLCGTLQPRETERDGGACTGLVIAGIQWLDEVEDDSSPVAVVVDEA